MLPILPPAPSRTDPTNFSAKADAWVDALDEWTDAANALEQSLQLVATTGTSTSSLPIGTGSKGLTTQTGKAWVVGSWVYIASASSITNLMQGQVTAYNAGTGNLVVNVTQSTGSGTYTDWVIALASPTTTSAGLSGGVAGSIPWQSGVNTTSMLAPGTAGQILSSNGSGAPSWKLAPGTLIDIKQFTAAGTVAYTPSTGTSSFIIEIQGGGGAGGQAQWPGTGPGQRSIGGSGGAGGFCRHRVLNQPGMTYTVTVGAGQLQGVGTQGSTSSLNISGLFTGQIYAYGGQGGAPGTAFSNTTSSLIPGGLGGGTATSNVFNTLLLEMKGGQGLPGMSVSSTLNWTGQGGKAFYGNNTELTATQYATSNAYAGVDGVYPGDGGSGGLSNNAGPADGGDGATGRIIIYEYA